MTLYGDHIYHELLADERPERDDFDEALDLHREAGREGDALLRGATDNRPPVEPRGAGPDGGVAGRAPPAVRSSAGAGS